MKNTTSDFVLVLDAYEATIKASNDFDGVFFGGKSPINVIKMIYSMSSKSQHNLDNLPDSPLIRLDNLVNNLLEMKTSKMAASANKGIERIIKEVKSKKIKR